MCLFSDDSGVSTCPFSDDSGVSMCLFSDDSGVSMCLFSDDSGVSMFFASILSRTFFSVISNRAYFFPKSSNSSINFAS